MGTSVTVAPGLAGHSQIEQDGPGCGQERVGGVTLATHALAFAATSGTLLVAGVLVGASGAMSAAPEAVPTAMRLDLAPAHAGPTLGHGLRILSEPFGVRHFSPFGGRPLLNVPGLEFQYGRLQLAHRSGSAEALHVWPQRSHLQS